MHLGTSRPHVRRFAGQQSAQDGAQAKDVIALVELVDFAARLLRGHVGRRAQYRSRLRRRLGAGGANRGDGARLLRLDRCPALVPFAEDLGESPVHDLDLAERPHHDVRGLQVAVQDASAVRVGQRLTQLGKDPQKTRQLVGGRGSFPQEIGESAALDEFHGEKGPAIV
jgi:hypothetical protein